MGMGFFDASQAMQGAGDFGNVAFGEGQGCQGCQGFGWEQMAGGFASQYLGIARYMARGGLELSGAVHCHHGCRIEQGQKCAASPDAAHL